MKSEPSAATGFASNPLDRRADLRDDRAALDKLLDAADRVVMSAEKIVLVAGEPPRALLTRAEAEAIEADVPVFLGMDERAVFGGSTGIDPEILKERGHLVIDLRSIAVQKLVSPEIAAILGEAKSMLDWHARHRFCARCGHATDITNAGWRRDCPACGATHFPRTDPVVIMLIHRGDKCVLGRKPQFAPQMYSCLAGFVEAGETFEDAVRRETLEEVGLKTGTVRYYASQPWPMPFSQLMIGCMAEALDEAITIQDDELADARWFTRDEVAMMRAGTHPEGIFFPPRIAIAHTLLQAWLDGKA